MRKQHNISRLAAPSPYPSPYHTRSVSPPQLRHLDVEERERASERVRGSKLTG